MAQRQVGNRTPLRSAFQKDIESNVEYGDAVPFEQVVAECGLTMDQVRRHQGE